jgi:hypothetical protein
MLSWVCCTGDNFLYPSDILPFTRRPLFIIVDSDNSSAFEVLLLTCCNVSAFTFGPAVNVVRATVHCGQGP